jgi:putative ABC transport system permease protein
LLKLALLRLEGETYRTWMVSLAAALVAAFAVAGTLVLGGGAQSLDLALQRLGADIIVVPAGAEGKVENALLMGAPVRVWMPESNLARLRAIPGVEVASPQVYLATLRGASCCTLPEMFLIAYDPETDFTVRPWLEQHGGGELALGEAIGGAFVYLPDGEEDIKLYGYGVDLRGNLEQTGAGLDATMFLTMDTARDVARTSLTKAEAPLIIEESSISAALIRVAPGVDPGKVAAIIRRDLPGVTPIESASLFGTQRRQMSGLVKSIAALLVVVWALAIGLTGVVFSMALVERKREMAVLRALGATKQSVAASLLSEAGVLALGGSLLGAAFAALAVYLFRAAIMRIMQAPFLYPAPLQLVGLLAAAVGMTLLSVFVAVVWPSLRMSRQEPAQAMRE